MGRSVGLLITERMIESNRLAYAAWVDAVKLGKAWPAALGEKTGAAPAELAWLVGRYYQVND